MTTSRRDRYIYRPMRSGWTPTGESASYNAACCVTVYWDPIDRVDPAPWVALGSRFASESAAQEFAEAANLKPGKQNV